MINQYTSLTGKLVKYTLDVVYIAGFIISIYAAVIYPSTINYIILASYFVFLALRIIHKNKKKFGTIISKEDRKPLPFTVVELYDTNNNQRVNFTVSDILGRYYLLANNGNYKLKIKSMSTLENHFQGEDKVSIKNGMFKEDLVV